MAHRLLLDSDILSEVLKGKNDQVQSNHARYAREHRQLSFCSATVMEILYGQERVGASSQIRRAEALFAAHHEIVPAAEDFRLAAKIAGALSRKGQTIGLMDPLIASCAIRNGYGIATGNTTHFEYIRELGYSFQLENWREG